MILSIITINKNNSAGLARTIDSVRMRMVSDLDYILVDGSSSDSSIEVLEGNSDCITVMVSEPDSGIYNAMNKGIRIAKGDYCLFLNSGDELIGKNTLARIISALESKPDILYSDAIMVGHSGASIIRSPRYVNFGFFLVNTINHQSTVIRRSLLLDEGLYREDLRIASDWYLFLKATAHQNLVFKYLPEPMAQYEGTGLSSTVAGSILNETERAACIAGLSKGIEPIIAELKGFNDSTYASIVRNFGNSKALEFILRVYRKIAGLVRLIRMGN